MKKTCLFDLDGTLTDPKEGITRSVAYALKHFSIEIQDYDALSVFIGPPLMDSFQEFYGFSYEDAKIAVAKYREYFSKQGIFENKLYFGIQEVLFQLQSQNIDCILATSKPEPFAKMIMDHFQLTPYFKGICGATLDETRNKKGNVIAYAMQTYELQKKDTLMIGDRKHDVLGAKENGLLSIGVTYGYGSKEELLQAGADEIATSVEELLAKISHIFLHSS